VLLLPCASTAPSPASLWLLPSAVVVLLLPAAVCCCFAAAEKKKPFDGGKNFFRRGYIDLRMHEEGYRAY
jgi:hypothetical protein